jgi:hypothetical protein
MSPELLRKPLHYDAARRRLWIYGQRCHHGATGALLAGAGALAGSATLLATGTALMAHDWHDRQIWFKRGWQNQP